MPKTDDEDRLWQWIIHEDDLFSARTNFNLVAQSMLFTAFALVFAVNKRELFLTLVATIGVILNFIWLVVTNVQLTRTFNPLKVRLRNASKLYKEVDAARKGYALNPLIGYLIPCVLLIVWIVLAATTRLS